MKFSSAVLAGVLAAGATASNLPHRGSHARFHEKREAMPARMIADLHRRDPTLAKRCCEMISVNGWAPFQNNWGPCEGKCGAASSAAPAAPATSAAPAAPAASSPAANEQPAAAQPHNQNTQAAASPSPSAAATASTGATSSGTSNSSNCKKGLSYNVASLIGSAWTQGGICWAYNWAGVSDSLTDALEFVPMMHDMGSVSSFPGDAAQVGKTVPLLSFNEPDMPPSSGGSQIDPATAAQNHKSVMAPLQKDGHPIGCPAVSNSGASGQGLSWLASFAQSCGSDCPVDFCPVHWYGWNTDAGTQASNFKQYITSAIAACQQHWPGKPVWVTEFAAVDASGISNAALNAQFLDIVAPWMEENSSIERYSPFMVGQGNALGGSTPSAAGLALIAAQ